MKTLEISPIKQFVAVRKDFPPLLRELILEEPDKMPADELVIKFGVWMRMLRESQD